MTMKLIKKTADYSIFQRGDQRYAVKDSAKNPVNGDEKVKILLAEGLITVTEAAPAPEPEPEPAEEAPEEAAGDEEPAGDSAEGDDDSAEPDA